MNVERKLWALWYLGSLLILNIHMTVSTKCEWKHTSVSYDTGVCSTTTVVCKNITMSTLDEFHNRQVSQDCHSKRCYAVDIHNSQIYSVDKSTLVTKLACKLYEIILTSSHIHTISDDAFANNPKVWKINLEDNEITTLNFLRGDLGNLHVLNLAKNKLDHIEEATFNNLKDLEELYLNNNLLNTIDDEAFASLVNLKDLRLNNNNLKVLSQTTFKGLPQNRTDSTNTKSFDELQRLESSNLTELDIGNLQPGAFNSLSHLVSLDLQANQLEAIPDKAFFYLNGLEVLDLSNNKLSALNLDSFEGLVNLHRLQINNNFIQKLPVGLFKSFPLLENLQLGSNYLSEFPVGCFTNLRELKYLNFSHNQFSAIDEPMLYSLGSLTALSLDNNNFDTINYKPLLLHLPKLSFVNFNNNTWSCSLLTEMLQAFKARNINYSYEKRLQDTPGSVEGISCGQGTKTKSQASNNHEVPIEMQHVLDELRNSTQSVSGLLNAVKDSVDILSEYHVKHLENYNKSSVHAAQMQDDIDDILDATGLKLVNLNNLIHKIDLLSSTVDDHFLYSQSEFRKIIENQKNDNLKYATREEYFQLVANLTKSANRQLENISNLNSGLYAIFVIIVLLFIIIIVLSVCKCCPRSRKNSGCLKTRSEIELLNASP